MAFEITRRSFVGTVAGAAAGLAALGTREALASEAQAAGEGPIDRVTALYFSPVRNTRNLTTYVAREIAKLLGCDFAEVDVTTPAERQVDRSFGERDLLVLGSPTYRGKVPAGATDDFATYLHGSGTPAVQVTCYGQRNYDNNPAQLNAILTANGFVPYSAAAFVTQHEMTSVLATGRPDDSDFREASTFAIQTVACLRSVATPAPLELPGDADADFFHPTKINGEEAHFQEDKPSTELSRCINCGLCATVCPLGSINPDDVTDVSGKCIKCHACIKRCPQHAKYLDGLDYLQHVKELERDFAARKENEFWYCAEA